MQQRRLAAIMFTDIVGYTWLMQKDEKKAKEVRNLHRAVLEEETEKIHGEILQYYGDGSLSIYNSSIEAVECAISIQKRLKNKVSLRIGLHVGDIVHDEEGIFGDGVNIASRIESMAVAGSVLFSEKLYDDIKNHKDFRTCSLGLFELKNLEKPLEIYAIMDESIAVPVKSEMKGKGEPKEKSIAVLPLINMSADPDNEYFCDGMAEEIINALTHIENLKVIARTSAFMFKGKNEDVREIGKKLDVETLLEGSVRKAGNRLRITVQLIQASDGMHIWSEAYNRELKDVFAIQEEISLAIVENLKVKLLRQEKEAIVKRHTEDLEAYNLYLKGRHYLQMLTTEGIKKAFEYFERSLQQDPNFPLAYVELARLYNASPLWGNVPPNNAYPKAKRYAKKALELNSTLGEAHGALGFSRMFYDWNLNAAEKEIKQALQLNPNSYMVHLYYSYYLTITKHHDEAISEAKRALELNPLSPYTNTMLGQIYWWAHRYDEAIVELRKTLSMNPDYSLAHQALGDAYEGKFMIREAGEAYKKAVDLSNSGISIIVSALACNHYELGEKKKAEEIMDGLKQRLKREYVPPMCFFLYHMARNDLDRAFEWLKTACEERDSWLIWWRVLPLERFRIPDEPRFNELLEKVGLQ